MIGNSQVLIVTLVSWKFLGEKPNKSILLSLPIVILGLALISGIWDNDPYGEDPLRGVITGIILILGSVIAVTAFGNTEVTTD
jgi:drug/metabolite transporter (DMT)-like permease